MPGHLALGSFARQIAGMGPEGGTLLTGDLDAERDFLLAADAARILLDLILLPAASGQVVNLCSGHPTSLRLLTERLIAASGRPVRLRRDAARQGITGMARHYGSAERLRGLGFAPPLPDTDRIAAEILAPLRG
jgi:GDP-4-dehydro-6-deoxy-D-mannose reductase